ncbi:MAG: type II toxin-antitoxin system VapB family antitoxin [Bryobacteraceae bacterium]
MAFSVKNPQADRMARALAAKTGESLTEAVLVSLKERLERIAAANAGRSLADELDQIAKRCAALPVLDARPADEILGYDERGLPR